MIEYNNINKIIKILYQKIYKIIFYYIIIYNFMKSN